MASDPEKHTVHLLREMRDEIRERFDKIDERFVKVDERFAALEMKTDGQSGQLSTIIGLLGNHADRLELLEGRDT